MSTNKTPEELFWPKVDRRGPDECWEWTANRDKDGYGKLTCGGRDVRAHRASWAMANGKDPGSLLVCHTCDNPPCVNSAHLFLATQAVNRRDCVAKGRAAKGDAHGRCTQPHRTAKGERHSFAKLTEPRVREIRRRVSVGETRASLARELGLSSTTVGRVASGKAWRHVV